ncbi:MAG TPA: phosphodiester glycosidase family protein [Acidimicrobiales bacterium]|nr:phosphodiester glycosidase family protein [Acidimicrobiales bacterium]
MCSAGAVADIIFDLRSAKLGDDMKNRSARRDRRGPRSSFEDLQETEPEGGPRHLRRPEGIGDEHEEEVPELTRWRYWLRRIVAVLCVLLVLMTPVWISLGSALSDQSLGPSLAARAAEWTRNHGGSGFVRWIENEWYSHHAPKVGGEPPKGAIPAQTRIEQITGGKGILPTPKSITPFALPAVSGEGDWRPIGRTVNGIPTMYETFMRPDPIHTSVVDGVVWMDTKLLNMRLYSGSYIPGGGPYKYTAPISSTASKSLVAAFNAGFREQDAQGGYYTDGHVILPLRNGAASLVIYKDGSANVVNWGRDTKINKNVESVRQNLNLLVDHGRSVTGLNPNDTSQWGFTLGNQVYVWRSGIGITKNGALVYVGGPGLNITTLANLLVRVGAIRAMELDINVAWVNFSFFKPSTPHGAATGTNGTNLLPGMAYQPVHYFEGSWSRDFFTASAR